MATDRSPRILVVDDEVQNLTIITKQLDDEPYIVDATQDGDHAWELLREFPDRYDAVLLDRMMPKMNGLQVLENIRGHTKLANIPVILQTARAAQSDIVEGIRAGAYYYLTKPFSKQEMVSIVRTAVRDRFDYLSIQGDLENCNCSLDLLDNASFHLQSLAQARELAVTLANAVEASERIVYGLFELLVNAIEHGNLGIGYETKTRLCAEGNWESEIERRLSMPENIEKQVVVCYRRESGASSFVISDQGEGFDWQDFLELKPERGTHTHGRGIALSRINSFSHIEYRGCGNEVSATLFEDARSVS